MHGCVILLTMISIASSFRSALGPVKMSAISRALSSHRPIVAKGKGPLTTVSLKCFPFSFNEELDLQIDDLTNLGYGIGRKKLVDGSNWVVMVPLVLPGETVKVQINRNHKSYSEATLVEVLIPSPDRVVPSCPYFSSCGGCQYQHMNITSQRKWKRSQVSTAISKIAGLDGVQVNDTVGTEHEYYYRSKITPHYVQSDGNETNAMPRVGFQRRNSRNIVDVEHCMVASRAINTKYSELRRELLSKDEKQSERSLLLRESDGGSVVTSALEEVEQTVGDIKFHFKAREFFQNNPHVLSLLVKHVLEQAVGHGCQHLVDTYCGSGLFALSAAKLFQSVHGVEISSLSVEAAQNNAKLNKISNAKFVKEDADMIFGKLKKVPARETVVIIDPPRRGCDASFLRQLFAFKPRKLVYISCEPTTQARDAERIVKEGYEVTNVTPFDMFPQTRHIENVITFVLKQ